MAQHRIRPHAGRIGRDLRRARDCQAITSRGQQSDRHREQAGEACGPTREILRARSSGEDQALDTGDQ